MTHIIFSNNPRLRSINFEEYNTAKTYHNSHMLIDFKKDHGVEFEPLLVKLRQVEGVSDADRLPKQEDMTLNIGTRSPTDPHKVLKKVLGMLQAEGLLGEADIHRVYEKMDLSPVERSTSNSRGREV